MLTSAFAAMLLVQAAVPSRLAADPVRSVLRFQVVHKLHRVNGESRNIEARSVIGPDGKVRAMVRAPVASFRSGDANRDAHMVEALDGAKHPFVVFKGIARLDPARVSTPATLETTLEGELELRGTRRPIVVPVSVEFAADGKVRVRGSFSFSLESHGIERPALLFVKIEDRCRIELDLALTEETP